MPVITKPFEPAPAFFAIPGFLLLLGGLLNPYAYARGLNNSDKPFFLASIMLTVAGVALLIGALIWVLATWSRSSKLSRRFGIACIAIPLLTAIVLLVFPLRSYERGVTTWARRHIDARTLSALRAWHADMLKSTPTAPATAATIPGYGPTGAGWAPYGMLDPLPLGAIEYDTGTFSSELLLLSPGRVWHVPAESGLFLEWGAGSYGIMQSRRFAFIGTDANSGPPATSVAEHNRWRKAAPGVWVLIE